MPYYNDQGSFIQTADVSHWRQPYKDWISLSDDPSTAVAAASASPAVPMFTASLAGHLFYVNTSMQSTLQSLEVFPVDATADQKFTNDPNLLSYGTDLPVGQIPAQNLWTMANVTWLNLGYAVILTNAPLGILVTLTKSPAVIAQLCSVTAASAKGLVSAILVAPPDLGVAAEALATGPIPTVDTTVNAPMNLPPAGTKPSQTLASLIGTTVSVLTSPITIALFVLGAVGIVYMVHNSKTKKARRS